MLQHIARHEGRVLLRERRLQVLVALLALVTFAAAHNGARAARARVVESARLMAAHHARTAQLAADLQARATATAPDDNATDARSARYVGGLEQPATLPIEPLAALAIGQSDLLPGLTSVSLWSASHTLLRNYEIENPQHLLDGRFDLAFVVIWLLPLFILAATHDIVSGGREDGTLPLALSQPVRPRTLILARLLTRVVLVLGATLALSLLGAFAAGLPVTAGVVAGLALWCTLVGAYGLYWCALGLALASWAPSSAATAVRLVVAWLVLVVLLPATLNVLVASVYPSPSRLAFIQATRAAANAAQERATSQLTHFYADHPELIPAGSDPDLGDFMTRFLTIAADVESQVGPLQDEYEGRLQRQQAWLQRWRLLSPATLLHEALTDLAGTDTARLRRFQLQARTFLAAWHAFFTPRIFARRPLSASDHASLPRFTFLEEPPAARQARTALALAGLLLPAAALAGLAVHALGRRRAGDF